MRLWTQSDCVNSYYFASPMMLCAGYKSGYIANCAVCSRVIFHFNCALPCTKIQSAILVYHFCPSICPQNHLYCDGIMKLFHHLGETAVQFLEPSLNRRYRTPRLTRYWGIKYTMVRKKIVISTEIALYLGNGTRQGLWLLWSTSELSQRSSITD